MGEKILRVVIWKNSNKKNQVLVMIKEVFATIASYGF